MYGQAGYKGSSPAAHLVRNPSLTSGGQTAGQVPGEQGAEKGWATTASLGKADSVSKVPSLPTNATAVIPRGKLQPDPGQQLGIPNLKPIRFAFMHLIPKPKLPQGPTCQLQEWNSLCSPHRTETPGITPHPSMGKSSQDLRTGKATSNHTKPFTPRGKRLPRAKAAK